jgi:hypothetical protein
VGGSFDMAKKPIKKKAGRKKRRRKKLKLTLRSKGIRGKQSYQDKVGWSTTDTSQVLGEVEKSAEPEEVEHQCSMCGSMMRIPRPKRDRYKVVCAHPECGHEDEGGV